MARPWLLDLFCGAGGAAVGYQEAGFDVLGVDLVHQPNYPFEFLRYDALAFLREHDISGFAAVHASPPCQGYSQLRHLAENRHPKLIARTRKLLGHLPYVIENVEGARRDLIDPMTLCGSSFGLRVRRHRLFETNWPVKGIECDHAWQDEYKPYRIYVGRSRTHGVGTIASGIQTVTGGNHNVGGRSHYLKSVSMGIDWMTEAEINQSIPPAFTRHLGRQLREAVSWPR